MPGVHPVAILSLMFCASVLMCVEDASWDHIVEVYSSMVFVMVMYRFLLFPPRGQCE